MTTITGDAPVRTEAEEAVGGTGKGGKFLSFFIADEEYGVEILKVQEIIGLLPITRVPRTAKFIKGLINLRGKVISVVDLRLKFGMEEIEPTDETCIIVVEAHGVQFGLLVDRVSEVVDFADVDVDDAPDFGAAISTEFILGMGKTDDRVTILLDIDRVLSEEELHEVESAEEAE